MKNKPPAPAAASEMRAVPAYLPGMPTPLPKPFICIWRRSWALNTISRGRVMALCSSERAIQRKINFDPAAVLVLMLAADYGIFPIKATTLQVPTAR